MKKLKKTISLGIISTLLLSMLVIPQSVSAATFPLGENFDSWSSLDDADQGKWKNRTNGTLKAGFTDSGVNLVDADGDKALELTTASQILFWVGDAGSSDKNSYKLSYSFKSNGGRLVSWLTPWRNGDDPNVGKEGSLPLINAINGTATLGRTNMDDGMTLGEYQTGEWYKAEVILDYTTRLCKVDFKDNDGKLIGTRTTAMDSAAYAYKLVLSNWAAGSGSVLVDDISLEQTDERVTVLTFEDFENVADLNDLKKGPFTNYKDQNWSTKTDIIDTVARGDNADNKAAETIGYAGCFDWWAGEALTSGTWKISLKVYIDDIGKTIYSGLGLSSKTCKWIDRQGFMGMPTTYNGKGVNGRKFSALGGAEPARADVISDVAAKEWYDYEVIIDLDKKVANAGLYRNGKKIGARREFSLVGSPIENGFDRLGFASWEEDSYHIDDLKVERLLNYKETIDDYIIYKEDFSNMTTDDLAKDGWVFSMSGYAATIENGALKLDAINNTNAEKWMTNTNANSKIKVKYDVLINDDNYILLADVIGIGATQNSSWFVDGTPISAYVYTDGVYGFQTYYHGHNKISDSKKGSWITIENVFDFKEDLSGTVTTTVRDKTTGALLSAGQKGNPATFSLRNNTAVDDTTKDTKNFQTLRFRNWKKDSNPYIDNIVVSQYYDEPSIDDTKVTLCEADGVAADDLENVTSVLKYITLDFGAEMDKDSAAENITLAGYNAETDEYDEVVSFIGDTDGTTYKMTIEDVLKPNTEYMLTVNKNVESSLGVKLNKNYVLTFVTADADCTVEKAELYSGTTELKNISGLSKDAKVTVKSNAINTYDKDENAVVMIGYYNGNKLVGVSIEPITITKNAKTPISKDFVLPDMTEITDVDVFIWDTTTNMVPWCDVLTLSK